MTMDNYVLTVVMSSGQTKDLEFIDYQNARESMYLHKRFTPGCESAYITGRQGIKCDSTHPAQLT
ncbi:hypothetical protein AB4259_15535 [Vibrio amylolyticus]|uniref:hypothetical protein n=1 Tax=Vibrio amylolyticus TaxID=2847292 RepID=UPI003553C6AD